VTRWLSATALQDPFDLGADANERAQWTVNVLVTKADSATFLFEALAVLDAAGVGVPGETLLGGADVQIPDGDGPFLFVTVGGGLPPLRTQGSRYPRPTAQLTGIAANAADAIATVHAGLAALLAVENADVVPLPL